MASCYHLTDGTWALQSPTVVEGSRQFLHNLHLNVKKKWKFISRLESQQEPGLLSGSLQRPSTFITMASILMAAGAPHITFTLGREDKEKDAPKMVRLTLGAPPGVSYNPEAFILLCT